MENDLYQGADRGTFRVMRLVSDRGIKLRVNARIKDARGFMYMTDLHYAIVGYTIEWWGEFDRAPYAGGTGIPYAPKERPNIERFYFRTKASNLTKMLYLEDAIINDFLSTKVPADPLKFNTYAQEAADQTTENHNWRTLEGTNYEFRHVSHITRLIASNETPLTVETAGMAFEYRVKGNEDNGQRLVATDYPFVSEREALTKIKAVINEAENES